MASRHMHTARCWNRYEPCGEHHVHDYNCGGGDLSPWCARRSRDHCIAEAVRDAAVSVLSEDGYPPGDAGRLVRALNLDVIIASVAEGDGNG